jgi:hypothetical protein
MEDWEIKLREKLELELEDKSYRIGTDRIYGLTGKSGKIDYEIALRKEMINSGFITNDELNKEY